MDLSQYNFGRDGPVNLDGEWEFWWNREPGEIAGPETVGYRLTTLPGYWSESPVADYPPFGSATYRIQLRLPAEGGPWSVGLPEIASAWRLTNGSQLLAENGRASLVPGAYQAHVRPQTVPLPIGLVELDLFLYVVNESDREGGVRDSIVIGPSAVLERQQRLSQLDSAFFIGGLLVMSLFNLLTFFLQRQKTANLWLALFSVCIAIRTLFTGPRIVYDLWPWLTFELSAQIVFLSILGAVASFIFYLKNLFPDFWPSRIFVPFLFYTAFFAVLLILPVKTYSEIFLLFYDVPMVLMIVLFMGVAWWATIKKHKDGPLVFFGMLFLVAGSLNDILYQFVPLPQGDVLGRFLFVFLVFNTFILSRQFSNDYALTQQQAGELRKLDKMKDDFLARVTHELRTPLHGMIGILDSFRLGDFGTLSNRQTYHLGLLEASSKRLLSMVNSILDFSNSRKHQMISELRPILLKECVDFLLPAFYPQLKSGVTLVNRINGQLPAVLGDEPKVEQVLHHLVQNALQHTESGSVSIEAELRDQLVLVIVRDTGEGIPEEKLAQLFSPFHQIAEIDTRATGGLGLGLAISRQHIQQMGGRLELESTVGTGTTVSLWLPVCPPAKVEYYQKPRLERTHSSEPNRLDTEASQNLPNRPSQTQASGSGTNVLIVDDEPVNLLVLRTFLTRNGYSVIEATSGPEALEKFASNPIDLIILDVMMPGMSGYEVCSKIREQFKADRLPILMLTAKNQVEDLMQGYQHGASDFLTKPFQREELKVRMELHLKVSKAVRDRSKESSP